MSAHLVLEDGTAYAGNALGYAGHSVGEIVFNTAMTGYQEILTDPSYSQQIVTLTYPHIGNTGCNDEDMESDRVHATGLVIRDYPESPSNWRAQHSLHDFLCQQRCVAITDIDTRQLTKRIREKGAMRACISHHHSTREAHQLAVGFPGLNNLDCVKPISTNKAYAWAQGTWGSAGVAPDFNVTVCDFGVKKNILRCLVDIGGKVTVVPATTSAQDILKNKPDLVVLSNGPGDPAPCDYAIATIQELLHAEQPMLGICLGFQLLALALGARIQKMKFGHHGANHPIQCLETKKVIITSQNHGFCVDESSLPDTVHVTHRSLFDGTLQGFALSGKPVIAFQGHPEASPGPQEFSEIFQHIKQLIKA